MSLKKDIVMACFVGDAAIMPLHWIYDQGKVKDLIGDKNPEFYPTPSCPFYNSDPENKEKGFPGHYTFGNLSPYGETGYVMLEYLKSTKGEFQGGEHFAKFQYQWFEKYTGRKDHPTQTMLKNAADLIQQEKPLYPECGAVDDQAYLTFKIPQLFLKFGDLEESKFLSIVEESVRPLQNKDLAIAWSRIFTILLKNLMGGLGFEAALDKVQTSLDVLLSSVVDEATIKTLKGILSYIPEYAVKLDPPSYSKDIGMEGEGICGKIAAKLEIPEDKKFMVLSCGYPHNFIIGSLIILQTIRSLGGETSDSFKKDGFVFGLRRNIAIAGDNCGRNWMISACLRALGAEVPATLTEKFADASKVSALIDEIVSP